MLYYWPHIQALILFTINRWLHRKAVEARREAARQKKYRKLFFQESQQLHRALTNRQVNDCHAP